ncbi:probable dolichyl pyrophosphate Man9GlcNAc2 alpha-1,3-glucosyltransferase [Culicoides brevitarsis]|uniref:probable dolichyl pyrophosphate Man9GlcNAc2 alpha-1,3-glucosyltransferase n=1 Tax=Culicoides brevitarsis TaxID=469753 RepID=UPI00307BC247
MEKLVIYAFLVCIGIFLRASISLYPHSGQNSPPMFGDYEAQRHWQEITVNLKLKNWYKNTTKNDLNYWGLDYPPLTAYHSYAMGLAAKAMDSSFVQLYKSRGIATENHKLFMRTTVLVADLLIYIPALIIVCVAVYENFRNEMRQRRVVSYVQMILCIAYPGQILIDNGHFQYNNVSLGFAALAVACLLRDKNVLGSLMFVLALNYKQMELYHALPFFFYLLGKSFRDTNDKFNFSTGFVNLIKIGATVITSFALIWSPWLILGYNDTVQVLSRLFPIYRGVFEDKVSNVWCIVNVLYKIKEHFTNEQMAMVCLTCTVAAVIPICLHLLMNPKKKVFLYALLNSSLAFFLFSFQVHEKSILLATLPAMIVFPLEPFAVFWFLQIATFSMFPLLLKDGLLVAYLASQLIYFLGMKLVVGLSSDGKDFLKVDLFNVSQIIDLSATKSSNSNMKRVFFYLSVYFAIVLVALQLFAEPPKNLPFLFPLMISAFSCVHFLAFFAYFSYKQLFCIKN